MKRTDRFSGLEPFVLESGTDLEGVRTEVITLKKMMRKVEIIFDEQCTPELAGC